MISLFNFHTHSFFCDGSADPERYVEAAIRAGFHSLGFSSHAPVPFNNGFAIQDKVILKNYLDSIIGLKLKYASRINIMLGLEVDYIKGMSDDFETLRKEHRLDYVIGSVHLVRKGRANKLWFIDGPRQESYDHGLKEIFLGEIREAVTAFYEQTCQMILTQKPDILGHFDKVKMHNRDRYFSEKEAWYRDLVMATLEAVRQSGIITEVNTRGIYKGRSNDLYPGVWVLREMQKMKMPITLSSDAHKPEEIDGHYRETLKILRDTGFRSLWYLDHAGWREQAI